MAPESRFFRVSISAALAIALIVFASSARAEVVTLVCQSEASQEDSIRQGAWGSSFTLRINYDQNIVDLLGPSGAVWFSAAAKITESDVRWNTWPNYSTTAGPGFIGSLNRLSGQGSAAFRVEGQEYRSMSGPCRRATQKF